VKRIIGEVLVLLLVVAAGWMNAQAEEEATASGESEGTYTATEEAKEPKGLLEMWQAVKDAIEKVKERNRMIEKTEKELAEATEEKAVETYHKTLKAHYDSLKKEVEALCAAIDELGKWVEPQVEKLKEELETESEGELETEPEEELETEPEEELIPEE
jgi:predicted RNase H-like nuclease (RuvC/YqgF family)